VPPCTALVFKVELKLLFFSHGVRLSPLGTAVTLWPVVPAPDDDDDDDDNDDDCGAISGM
jgi:hypothetical protein